MRTFHCHCGNRLFFDNTRCLVCGRATGFIPSAGLLAAFDRSGEDWVALAPPVAGLAYRPCQNYAGPAVCNWMVPRDSRERYCQACRLNQVIPDLSELDNQRYWKKIEAAKRRLIYTLNFVRLPVVGRSSDAERGLGFAFLADPASGPEFSDRLSAKRVLTGHDRGVITINIAEADDVAREKMRKSMRERYRTLLGHFRHEIGHYYWQLLIDGSERLDAFRACFGDERADYTAALQRYYAQGPVSDWTDRYVSPYASSHPWEDWAECFAHYLHMVDTLEAAFELGFSSYGIKDLTSEGFSPLLADWLELTVALNELNRCMGLEDAYPFVLSQPAQRKLEFVHELVASQRASTAAPNSFHAASD